MKTNALNRRLGLHSWPLLLLMMLVAISKTEAGETVEIFVSPSGRVDAKGTRNDPVGSLERARDLIRELRKSETHRAAPVKIWLRKGAYARSQTFTLGKEDSGSAQAPVEISAWKNEPVLLVGGVVLKDFSRCTDPETLARLPQSARNLVMECALPESGSPALADLSMKSRGFGRPITRSHPELFVNGRPMTLARWPNEGTTTKIAGFPSDSGQGDEHGGKIGKIEGGFFYEGDRPSGWKDPGQVWVHGYWAWDWANSYEQIGELDLGKRWVKTLPPYGLYGFRKNQPIFFLNVLEELDTPGEWFLDAKRRKVVFWPPDDWKSGEVLLSVLETPLIHLKEASHVQISGLRIEAGRSHGILMEGGSSNSVVSCAIRLMGNYGAWIAGGQGHRVDSCEITDTGDGGVSVDGGDRQTLRPGGHQVLNSHFRNQGRWSKCYVPAVLVGGVGHRIANNHIEQHPHCAILFTGNEHRVEYNEIHHVALETGDVGAIYTGRDWTFRGNAIVHNYIHHTGGIGMGSMGAYMDDCVSGTEIRGNIFEKVQRAAFLGGGRDHRVINNLFLDCKPAVQLDGRGMDQSPVWHNMVFDFMRKQLDAVPSALYRERYPEIAKLDAHYARGVGVPPEGNVVQRNVCVGGEWTSVGWHAKAAELDLSRNYVGRDPGFKNLQLLDLRLVKGGAAESIGFEPIPRSKIGPQDNSFRRRLVQYVLPGFTKK